MNWIKVFGVPFIILGILLFFLGVMFKILHWPGLYVLLFSGPVVFILGLALLSITSKK
ncbi:hypothetical protein [Aquimarina mytili]|uniref:hypothetical protein n=1 Tax=Aquimarina mytili TaxID=874423 RepID=UPI00191D1194|nr:hypothetical protein [Aquimarina mytili]